MSVSLEIPSGPTSGSASTARGKIQQAAQQFEAILLADVLEKLQKSFSLSEESQDPAHDTLSGLGTQALAGALAARGGIGFSRMLVEHLSASPGNRQLSGQATAIQAAVNAFSALPADKLAARTVSTQIKGFSRSADH